MCRGGRPCPPARPCTAPLVKNNVIAKPVTEVTGRGNPHPKSLPCVRGNRRSAASGRRSEAISRKCPDWQARQCPGIGWHDGGQAVSEAPEGSTTALLECTRRGRCPHRPAPPHPKKTNRTSVSPLPPFRQGRQRVSGGAAVDGRRGVVTPPYNAPVGADAHIGPPSPPPQKPKKGTRSCVSLSLCVLSASQRLTCHTSQ